MNEQLWHVPSLTTFPLGYLYRTVEWNGGMEWWNGMVEWWNGMVEWNGGMEHRNRILEWPNINCV